MKAFPNFYLEFELSTIKDLVKSYPKSTHKSQIEELLRLIGNGNMGFNEVRGDDFNETLVKIGFPKMPKAPAPSVKSGKDKKPFPKKKKGTATHPVDDPKTVKYFLRSFNPTGTNNQKIATLRDEALSLNLNTNPIAFCFLLRSMFEISSKNFCDIHGIASEENTSHDKCEI